MRLSTLLFLLISVLFNSCSTDPPDPALALPRGSGLSLLWRQGQVPIATGFPDLDGEIARLRTALPAGDSLDRGLSYAAFAYNLRPRELAAGLAVATAGIQRPPLRKSGNQYRGIPLNRLDSIDLLYAEYAGLSLLGREAVILQEMIDQLRDGDAAATAELAAPTRGSVLELNFAALATLLSTHTSGPGKGRLSLWARQWQSARVAMGADSLVTLWLQPGPTPARPADELCLDAVPGGIAQFAILPTPAALTRETGRGDNWSTYFAPWLAAGYARLTTKEGEAVAFCPRDPKLMQDLIDRLESDFPVTDRLSYPNGTIWHTEARGLVSHVLPVATQASAWVLRTPSATYLATDRAVLEKILDLNLLSGRALPAAPPQSDGRRSELVFQLDHSLWTDLLREELPGWAPPAWTKALDGRWAGVSGTSGYSLSPLSRDSVAPVPAGQSGVPPISVAWRWDAPDEVARLLPIPGRPEFAVYLGDGTLLVLDAQQRERVLARLGTAPNSPVYYLPPSNDLPERWLFSTPSAVYLIGPTGEAVAGFPYRPLGGLAAGVLVDDLDRATDPAYFLPLRSGRIEAYSLRGLPLVNWEVPTDFPAAAPLLTLHSDTSTYLAAVDSLSRVRVFDRRGAVYLAFDSLPSPFVGPLQGQLAPGTGVGRLAALELDGRVRVMSLGGGQFPLRVTTAAGEPRQFLFEQLWGDPRKDYLVGRDDAVALFAYAENQFALRWQARFPASIERIFTLPSLQLVGGLDRSRGLIYLLRGADGSLVEEQGLAGRVPGLEQRNAAGETLLITAYRKTVYAYRIAAGT